MHTASSARSTNSASLSASECTATVAMPILRAVLMTRQAISPRFAIRIFLNMYVFLVRRSERDVAVLAPRILELLVLEHRQRAAHTLARLVRHDHVVDEAARARHERVGEALLVHGFALGDLLGVVLFLAEDDLHRTLRAHDRDLGARPGEVDVATQVLGRHH